MDHAHAHPPSRRASPTPATLPGRLRPTRDRDVDRLSASPSARQQRLLRTRNARFPAKKLSISSLSSRFSQLIKSNDQTAQVQSPTPTNQENSAIVYRPHRDYGHSHSTSSLGILEEITNSIGVHSKSHNKRAPIPIFQDSPHRGLLEESPYASPSPRPEASSQIHSPATFDHIQDSLGSSMGLREISGNARKVSPLVESPPIVATIRSGRRRTSTAKSRFNSEEYIEHIERELALVKTAVCSPTSNRPWKEKLKSSRIENERLRKEIIDVKSAFEAEVQKTVEHMAAAEFDLKRKIRSLEDELESKESTIQQLECQHDKKRLDQSTVDTLKTTIDKLEMDKLSLEQENESMSRRNEVLSQLLALSPTKSQHFDLSSPVRTRNNPRPMSMMIPRLPSSPGGARISRPQSVVASPSASTSGYFGPKSGSMSTPPHSRMQDLAAEGFPALSLRRSLTGSTSRRSTLNSDASMSPASLDLQQTESDEADQPAKPPNPKRRTRRFLQGSTQLKPLLLPTLTGENGVLNSAYSASPVQGQRREFSEESLDPTTTFLSKSSAQYEPELDSYPFGYDPDTLTANSRHLAYQSLEGVLDSQVLNDGDDIDVSTSCGSFPHALPIGNIDMSVEAAWENPSQGTPDQWLQGAEQDTADDFDMTILPSYAYKESKTAHQESVALGPDSSPSPATRHSSVEMPEPLFSPFSRQKASPSFFTPNTKWRIAKSPNSSPVLASGNSRNSRKRRKLSISSDEFDAEEVLPGVQQQPPMASIETLATMPAPTAASIPTHSRISSSSCLSLRSPARTKSPLEILQQRNIGARPLAAVTIKTIYGTLSNYTSYMREIRRDPLALARRVIANAWHANWALLGKLSWWILGVFLGPSRGHHQGHAWDWDDYDAESIADQHCRRRSRDLDGQDLRFLPPSQSLSPERQVRFDEQHSSYRTRGSRSPARPALKKRLGWGESLLLWGKFSVAIMMAVGGAVVKGPAEMMRDADERSILGTPARRSRGTMNESRSRRSPKDRAIHSSMKPMDLPATASHRRLKKRSPSPPPSARTILQSGPQGSSSPQIGPAPAAFQFGNGENFQFLVPGQDHDWGEFDFGRMGEVTPKSGRPNRAVLDLDNLFSSPLTGPGEPILKLAGTRRREYDPEGAGAGLVFFDPLKNVLFAEDAGGGSHEVNDDG